MGRRSSTPIDLTGDVAHGTSAGYRQGCGCTPCRRSHAADHRKLRHFKAQQLGLFDHDAAAVPLRRVRAQIPDGLDLDAVAAALADPDPQWKHRARCRGRADLAELFFTEAIAQVRDDGTLAYAPPGDYVPDHWQDWCRQGCPVWADCVAAGLAQETTRYRTGFWGTTPAQRVHIAPAVAARRRATA